GIELFGIPLEEHLFMVVIPAFVIGMHEMLGQVRDDETGRANTDD
ncbi:lycopene cyclase, partial [Halogeometricum borinquense]